MSNESKTHAERHPNDQPHPEGYQRVRVDGGDAKVPVEDRRYVEVRAGYGEGARAASARRIGLDMAPFFGRRR